MARVLIVIAKHEFADEALFEPLDEFETAGHKCVVASTTTGLCKGLHGGHFDATMSLSAVDPSTFDALAFIGGPGAKDYFDDPEAHRVLHEADETGAVLAAIEIAPVILANAGLLTGKRVAVFSDFAALITEKGAKLQPDGVTIDGRIVTASGTEFARSFGKAVARMATKRAGLRTEVTPA